MAALSAALLSPGGVATAAPALGDLYAASGSNGVIGHLYTLNPLTGAVITDFGELRDLPGSGYGITGLAFQPGTGVLYGSTSGRSPTASRSLVRIDPVTAVVTFIGAYGLPLGPLGQLSTLSDLTFDPVTGVLYGWQSAGDHQLHTVNLLTGVATLVTGSPVTDEFGGGGLAMNSQTDLYVTPDGVSALVPTIQLLDELNGSTLSSAPLTPGFVGGGSFILNALAFDGSDNLFGVNTDTFGPAASTHLVRVNTTTGLMTDVGASPSDLDGIAFYVPEPATTGALAACVVGLGLAWRRGRQSV